MRTERGASPYLWEAEHGVGPNTGSGSTYWRAHLITGERCEFRCTQMRVRPDPLILGKEFADEGCGTESHSAGDPGATGSVFIPQLTS
jgi:hypothetical protein